MSILLLMGSSVINNAQGVQSNNLNKQKNSNMKNQSEIYFAGGCFWGTEHFLKQIRGVESTEVGYANGNIANPTYEQVCSGNTNFAETVKVVYDPQEVKLPLLIDLYFKTIDPTSINRQGNDRGSQYRTGIYYTDKAPPCYSGNRTGSGKGLFKTDCCRDQTFIQLLQSRRLSSGLSG